MDNDSLKVTMVIPSYWSRDSSIGWKRGDAVYDHPTPLDMDGTLAKTIESIDVLNDKDFRLVVIAVATAAITSHPLVIDQMSIRASP